MSKQFFLHFFIGSWLLGSGSVDPHIFADPNPGSQNLKHWFFNLFSHSIQLVVCKALKTKSEFTRPLQKGHGLAKKFHNSVKAHDALKQAGYSKNLAQSVPTR